MDKESSLTAFVLILLICVFGCADPNEYASFEAEGAGELPDCMADQFPFEPRFQASRTRDNRTGIFLQSSPDVKSRVDAFYFELYDTNSIQTDTDIDLADTSVSPPVSRSKMAFFSSCFGDHTSLKIEGTIRLDSFDTGLHGVISGSLEDGRAVDARTGETKIEDLSGSWRFVVRRGPPHEDFYALPERP